MTNTTLANNLYPVANATASSNPFVDVFMTRDPIVTDVNYPVQKKWLNTINDGFWILEGFTSTGGFVQANWIKLGTGAVVIDFTVDAFTAPGTNPVVPTAGNVTVTGGQVPAGTTTNVIRTDSLAASTYTIEIQRSQAVASSTVGDNGVSHFNSAQFTVDTNAFVSLKGGTGPAIQEVEVDTSTPPGTNPVIANSSGQITVTGGQVAAGTTANVIQTDSLAANTYTIQVQRSQAVGSSTVADNGVCHFNSSEFTVDTNGFVSLVGGGSAIEGVIVDAHTAPGTSPVVPNGSGDITVTGGQVAAGTTANVIQTNSLAANTYTVQIQRSQAVASSTIGDNGVCHFNSAQFSVDANGFVSSLAMSANYTNVTHAMSPYTVLTTDYYISVDCSGGTVTLNFPNSPTFKQVWVVKDRTGNASTNNISITTPGGTVTFDGQTTYKIAGNYGSVNLLANATPTYEIY